MTDSRGQVTGSDLDSLSAHDAIIALERQFPGWMIFRGTEGLCHARRHSDGMHVRGEDWVDLRDMLLREIGRSE